MIRFGAIVSVVAVAIGLLVAGAAWGDLRLVYVSIGLAALALLMLVVGVAVWRDQVFGGASAPTPTARPDAYAAGIAGPDQSLSDAVRQPEAARQPQGARQADRAGHTERVRQAERVRQPEKARRADTTRRVDPAAQAEAAVAELGGLADRKTADPRAGRQAAGAAAAPNGRPSAGDTDDWTADPGPWNRDKREQPAREWPASRPVQQDQPARRPGPPDQQVRESTGTGQPAGSGEAVTSKPEPTPAAVPDIGPADDPTRLARRLGAAAELSQKPGAPPTEQSPARMTSAKPRSADPLTGPPPAAAAASGRTRLQKEAAAAAAGKSPVPPVAGPDVEAEVAPAESQQDVRGADEVSAEVGTAEGAAGDAGSSEAASTEAAGVEAASVEAASVEAAGPASGDMTTETIGLVSIVPGIARYHLADCILIRFLSADDLETMTVQAAEAAGCVPCRACRPGKADADV